MILLWLPRVLRIEAKLKLRFKLEKFVGDVVQRREDAFE